MGGGFVHSLFTFTGRWRTKLLTDSCGRAIYKIKKYISLASKVIIGMLKKDEWAGELLSFSMNIDWEMTQTQSFGLVCASCSALPLVLSSFPYTSACFLLHFLIGYRQAWRGGRNLWSLSIWLDVHQSSHKRHRLLLSHLSMSNFLLNHPKAICQASTVPLYSWRARWCPAGSQKATAGWQAKKKQVNVLKSECQSDSRAAQTFPLCSSPPSEGLFNTAWDRICMAHWMIWFSNNSPFVLTVDFKWIETGQTIDFRDGTGNRRMGTLVYPPPTNALSIHQKTCQNEPGSW